jgi:hypothetical protein
MAKRNSNKPQEHGRTGWRSRSGEKHFIVSPIRSHSGNTGSNPVGDANKILDFHEPAVFLHDPDAVRPA